MGGAASNLCRNWKVLRRFTRGSLDEVGPIARIAPLRTSPSSDNAIGRSRRREVLCATTFRLRADGVDHPLMIRLRFMAGDCFRCMVTSASMEDDSIVLQIVKLALPWGSDRGPKTSTSTEGCTEGCHRISIKHLDRCRRRFDLMDIMSTHDCLGSQTCCSFNRKGARGINFVDVYHTLHVPALASSQG